MAIGTDGTIGKDPNSSTNQTIITPNITSINLKAGTATAGTAPLKFTSGTNLTTPEAGAVEYDGTYLSYTDGTPTRAVSGLPNKDIYSGSTKKKNVIQWHGSATTTSGVATFYPTSDGTGAGTAIFTNIYSVQVTASADTAATITVPLAAVKLIAADKKSITANVVKGVTLAALGDTVTFVADGTVTYMTITGD